MSSTIEIRIGDWTLPANIEHFWNNGMDLAIVVSREAKNEILAGGILENVGRFATPVEIVVNDVEVYTYSKINVTNRHITDRFVIDFTEKTV